MHTVPLNIYSNIYILYYTVTPGKIYYRWL